MRDRFAHLAVVIAMVALAIVVAACGSPTAGSSPPLEQTDADVTITSRDKAFDQASLTIEAESAASLRLVNGRLESAARADRRRRDDHQPRQGLRPGEPDDRSRIGSEPAARQRGCRPAQLEIHNAHSSTLVAVTAVYELDGRKRCGSSLKPRAKAV
jgi:hypothetical protein